MSKVKDQSKLKCRFRRRRHHRSLLALNVLVCVCLCVCVCVCKAFNCDRRAWIKVRRDFITQQRLNCKTNDAQFVVKEMQKEQFGRVMTDKVCPEI